MAIGKSELSGTRAVSLSLTLIGREDCRFIRVLWSASKFAALGRVLYISVVSTLVIGSYQSLLIYLVVLSTSFVPSASSGALSAGMNCSRYETPGHFPLFLPSDPEQPHWVA